MIKKSSIHSAFFSSSPILSVDVFRHCIRVPEVMERVIEARQILNIHRWPVPIWMMALMDKGEDVNIPSHLYFMSFLLSMGFYDRLCRLFGVPRFLMGFAPAVCVCAEVKNFEKTVMEMAAGYPFSKRETEKQIFKIYRKSSKKSKRFSLVSFSKDIKYPTNMSEKQKQHFQCCPVLPSMMFHSNGTNKNEIPFPFEQWTEKDIQLSWLWSILKHCQHNAQMEAKSKFISFSSHINYQ